RRSASGTADTVMNNIFFNARSNATGTGKHYATFLNANNALISNHNDLFVNGTGGVLGLSVATDYATLAAWVAATSQDGASISSDPKLVNPIGNSSAVDLHIQAGVATGVERGGYNIPYVTTDYDNQTRSSFSPVDIGADAGNFILSDENGPAIYYTPLIPSSCNTGNQSLNGVVITDATGIPLAGGLIPRIYYRKGSGTWFSQPGTLVGGVATNSTWNFTIVAADMGGLIVGDVVSYYVIAQDITSPAKVTSNAVGVVATDVNTVTSHLLIPSTYTVGSGISLSGTYTVGAGGAFTTLTAAVAAYNAGCLNGPVTFSLTDATYPSETFPITINANAYASAVNTLTIKPAAGQNPVISGSSASAIIVLNGADFVTIDGSNGAGNNSVCPRVQSTRNLTITNTNTVGLTAGVAVLAPVVTNGCQNATIKNANISSGINSVATTYGIFAGGATIGSTINSDHDNLLIENNGISRAHFGITCTGSNVLYSNDNVVIQLNTIGAETSADYVTVRGVDLAFTPGVLVRANTIFNLRISTVSTTVTGVEVGSTMFGARILENVISGVENSNTGGWSAAG
ncbi:MAG: hypothetical protein ACKOZV_12525, partial [Bacteroidota bacterium]